MMVRSSNLLLAGLAVALGALAFPSRLSAHADPCALLAQGSQAAEWFGFSLDVDQTPLVVGAPGDGNVFSGAGTVYVFDREGSGWRNTPSRLSGQHPGERFGFSVSLSQDTLAVGAPAGDSERARRSGVVYLFRRNETGWVLESTVAPTDAETGDQFGYSVAVHGDTLVAGAPSGDDRGSLSGAAYVFERSNGTWTQQQKLLAPGAKPADQFGYSVAIEGNTVVAGAPFADFQNRRNLGIVHVFQRSGTTWSPEKELTPTFREDDLRFGWAVALDSSALAVGAPGDDLDTKTDAGSVHVYTRESFQLEPLQPAPEKRDLFGSAVAVRENMLVVGAPRHDERGAVFQYSRTNGVWSPNPSPRTGKYAAQNDAFGSSVAVGEKEIVIGGPMDDVSGLPNAGSVAVCPIGETGGKPQVNVSIAKDDGLARICPGDPLTYRIEVSNKGPDPVDGVTVKDESLPIEGLRNVRWECAPKKGATCEPEGSGTLEDTKVSLPNGSKAIYTVRAIVAKNAQGTIENEASVTLPAEVNNTGSPTRAKDSTEILPPGNNLEVEIAPPASLKPGGLAQYEVTVTNRGPGTAKKVKLTDEVAGGATPISASAGCIPEGSGFSCALGDIPPGASVTRQLDFKVDQGCPSPAAIVNRAEADVQDPGECDSSGFAEISTQMDDAEADLRLTLKVDEVPTPAGCDVKFQWEVANAGPDPACAVVLDQSISLATFLSPLSAPGPCQPTADGFHCMVAPKLASGDKVAVETVFQLGFAQALQSEGTVSSQAHDPVDSNNKAGVAGGTCDDGILAIDKTDDPDPVAPGGELTYTITVENKGPMDALGVSVKDITPAELTDVQWCQGEDCSPTSTGPLVTEIDLLAGASKVFLLRGVVPPACGTLLNTASAEHSLARAEDNEETRVEGLALLCQHIDGTFVEGSTVTYTFVLVNCGPAAQMDNPGDELTNTLPPGLTLVTASASSGTTFQLGNTVTWNGAAAVGQTVTITIQATIDLGTAGTTLCNQAAGSFDLDENGTNETVLLSDDPHMPGGPDPCCFTVPGDEVLPIPTLSDLAAVALALLLATLSLRRLRRPSAGR